MKALQLLALTLVLSPAVGLAEKFVATGTVKQLQTQAIDLFGPDVDYVLLNGFNSAGSCGTYYANGLVVIRIPGDSERLYSIALAAHMANKELTVSIDDTRKDTAGYCIARSFSIKN